MLGKENKLQGFILGCILKKRGVSRGVAEASVTLKFLSNRKSSLNLVTIFFALLIGVSFGDVSVEISEL